MENASKALVMAGAVLIAILLISLTMYIVSGLREYNKASSIQTLSSQTEAFNRFFIYSKPSSGKVKGSDVYNIIRKAIDINEGWNEQSIEIYYLGVNYSNKAANAVKNQFFANDKALLEEEFNYDYSLSQITGMVEKITFTK